jgi:hypothetical protein
MSKLSFIEDPLCALQYPGSMVIATYLLLFTLMGEFSQYIKGLEGM